MTDGSTCQNTCSKNGLVSSVKGVIQDEEMSAKLTGGTNKKIDEELDYDSPIYNFDRNTYIDTPLTAEKECPANSTPMLGGCYQITHG